MDKELFDFVAERADVLSKSDFSTQVTKDAAQAWKDAVAADAEAADTATETLLNALEERPTTIDGVIGFLEGPAKEVLGEQTRHKASPLSLSAKRQERNGATVKPAPPQRRFLRNSVASSYNRPNTISKRA
ncbi:3-hydroxyisobutyrate dehydrogenase [Slackia sp.]|uniref:3-hydroxyisobutyrate dehydrogenase n=1 Tax=Slackia sp. TaxID=2049041 RepID=UPI002608DC72|nr:3-hydroxyisobutyrate dehydrogenase [Slackia sp.]